MAKRKAVKAKTARVLRLEDAFLQQMRRIEFSFGDRAEVHFWEYIAKHCHDDELGLRIKRANKRGQSGTESEGQPVFRFWKHDASKLFFLLLIEQRGYTINWGHEKGTDRVLLKVDAPASENLLDVVGEAQQQAKEALIHDYVDAVAEFTERYASARKKVAA